MTFLHVPLVGVHVPQFDHQGSKSFSSGKLSFWLFVNDISVLVSPSTASTHVFTQVTWLSLRAVGWRCSGFLR